MDIYESIVGKHKTEIDTPALLLDMNAVERNITKMAAFFADKECKLRPHVKTHKLPLIAKKQIEAGAIGVTCAKLGEAQVFLDAGIEDILIANEIVGDIKIRKLVELAGRGRLIVCVDDLTNAKRISEIAAEAGRKVDVLVEVNVGLDRCGVLPGGPTLEFVKEITGLRNLVFKGLMGYEGGLFIHDSEEKERRCRESNAALVETKKMVERDGFPVEVASAGGSNTFYLSGTYPGITDVQVGSYVTMDSHNRSHGLDFEQALTVLTTVTSRPEKGRAITDAGKKAISCDEGLSEFIDPQLTLYMLNEEHGRLKIEDPEHAPKIGDKLEMIPSHGCTTIPLYDRYVLTRNDLIEAVVPITARQAI